MNKPYRFAPNPFKIERAAEYDRGKRYSVPKICIFSPHRLAGGEDSMEATIDTRMRCASCGGEYSIREILESGGRYWRGVDAIVSERPCCKAGEELRIATGKCWSGYTYAAGAPHFCEMEEYDAPTLVRLDTHGGITFTLDGKRFRFSDVP